MGPCRIKDLTCNYHHNPMGIGLAAPFFSWRMESDRPGVHQQEYAIQAALSDDFAQPIWDTKWVQSDISVHIVYEGPPLESMTKYYWRARIKDNSNQISPWSAVSNWETGLKNDEWQAEWIEPEAEVDPKAYKPAPYLRRCFDLRPGVKEARLYITAHGLYEAYLNGKRVGDDIFMPGNTSYTTRLQVQVYDVLENLETGKNCMGVILGDGWYRGAINVASTRNAHGDKVGLLSQLKITYANGEIQWVCTDQNWKTSTGPIVSSDMKDGEVYDARREMPGWNEVDFNENDWHRVQVADHGYKNLIPTEGAPIRKMETLLPKEIRTTPEGDTVIDFGQNIAGIVRMKVRGERGVSITLHHSEVLDQNGNFSLKYLGQNVGGPVRQRDVYILNGEDLEIYEPHFTVHGFRYVKVEGYPGEVLPENFEAYAIYSDLEETGKFECSNPKLNQLTRNIQWSMKGNFLDIPTDCPTRERAGWTGDAQIFVHAGSLLMNDASFYAKWIQDVSAEQYPDGRIRNVVPDIPMDIHHPRSSFYNLPPGSSGWGDAVVIIPWTLYQMFGDTTILRKQYDSMKKWVEYERKNAERSHWLKRINPVFWINNEKKSHQKYIWDTKFQLGEWLEPDVLLKNVGKVVMRNLVLSDPIVATAYYAYSCRLLGKIAGVLGKVEDQKKYTALAEQIRQAYIKEFIRPDGTTTVYSQKQAPYVRTLAFGLYSDELRPKLEEKLLERVEAKGRHLFTGFLSTPFLLSVLSEAGRTDMAYEVLLKEDNPSWLYAINHGATTIWEDWEGVSEEGVPTASQNHYSKGAVVSWFFEYICGIQYDVQSPAYKHFHLKPQPGGGLRYARASFNSPYGEIRSEWEDDGSEIKYMFTIPPNTSASVHLEKVQYLMPLEFALNFRKEAGMASFDLFSGKHEFLVKKLVP